jgi:two-component system, sensor histidine kinase RegB
MRSLFSFFKQPLSSDRLTVARSIVYLRLTVLIAGWCLLLSIHFGFRAHAEFVSLSLILFGAGLWSIFVLRYNPPLAAANAIARELVIDFVWVFLVVLLSGRSASPFIYYYLVLVATSSVSLSARGAWIFCVGGIAMYSGLLFLDANQHFAHFPEEYRLHLFGMWLNYVGSTLVICLFVTRLTRLLREQQTELAKTREDNLKNEQLIGIGTVAASTVHSLATPIATLTVLAEEIIHDPNLSSALQQDVSLMLTQIARCKHTMNQLSTLAQGGSSAMSLSLKQLLDDLQDHYALNTPSRLPQFVCDDQLKSLNIHCNALFQYALINLINNAMESGEHKTAITIHADKTFLTFVIENSSRLSDDEIGRRWGRLTQSEKRVGLGIGSFLANTTIEKQGGMVELNSSVDPLHPEQTHIVVRVSIPLEGKSS